MREESLQLHWDCATIWMGHSNPALQKRGEELVAQLEKEEKEYALKTQN